MLQRMIVVLVFLMLAVPYAEAKDNVLGLDDARSFNIYISNGSGGVSAIRDVDIVEFREISGVVFLVVRDDGFNSKSTHGLIKLDAIQAVLPTLGSIRIQKVSGELN